MFPRGHQTSADEAGTSNARDPRERSLAAQGERSEKPVAGTDAVAQADLPGQARAARLRKWLLERVHLAD
jgi:hypothetical protein